jgi:hypothetical protein
MNACGFNNHFSPNIADPFNHAFAVDLQTIRL